MDANLPLYLNRDGVRSRLGITGHPTLINVLARYGVEPDAAYRARNGDILPLYKADAIERLAEIYVPYPMGNPNHRKSADKKT